MNFLLTKLNLWPWSSPNHKFSYLWPNPTTSNFQSLRSEEFIGNFVSVRTSSTMIFVALRGLLANLSESGPSVFIALKGSSATLSASRTSIMLFVALRGSCPLFWRKIFGFTFLQKKIFGRLGANLLIHAFHGQVQHQFLLLWEGHWRCW